MGTSAVYPPSAFFGRVKSRINQTSSEIVLVDRSAGIDSEAVTGEAFRRDVPKNGIGKLIKRFT